MEGFRRFILSVVEGLALFCVLITTLGGALIGGAGFGYATGSAIGIVFGILIGGFIGFIGAALATALLFVLMDISANTRRTREFVEGMGLPGQTLDNARTADSQEGPVDNARTAVSQEGPEAPQSQPLTAEMRKQFAEQLTRVSIGKDGALPPRAQAILMRAFEDGWRMSVERKNRMVLSKPGEIPKTWSFTEDILYFGKYMNYESA